MDHDRIPVLAGLEQGRMAEKTHSMAAFSQTRTTEFKLRV